MRKTGKRLIEKFVTPIINKNKKEQTGAAADPTEEIVDPLASIDWEELQKKVRWPHLQRYYELFGNHPTWGSSAASKTFDTAVLSCDDDDEEPNTFGDGTGETY